MAEMPGKFEILAVYNGEVARGIVHTADWDARMATLQAEYEQWLQRPHAARIRDAMAEAMDHPGRTITR